MTSLGGLFHLFEISYQFSPHSLGLSFERKIKIIEIHFHEEQEGYFQLY